MSREKTRETDRVSVPLSSRDRELILEYSLASDDLLTPLRALPKTRVHSARFTLYELEELIEYLSVEANYSEDDLDLQCELDGVVLKLDTQMQKYDDGNWQSPAV